MVNVIIVYCDGGCSGNQYAYNEGGWVVIKYGGRKLLGGKAKDTTSQVMELTAVIGALKSIPDLGENEIVEIRTDSRYVVDCINEGWYKKWFVNGWKTSTRRPVVNKELWQELFAEIRRLGKVSTGKVKLVFDNQSRDIHKAHELVWK